MTSCKISHCPIKYPDEIDCFISMFQVYTLKSHYIPRIAHWYATNSNHILRKYVIFAGDFFDQAVVLLAQQSRWIRRTVPGSAGLLFDPFWGVQKTKSSMKSMEMSWKFHKISTCLKVIVWVLRCFDHWTSGGKLLGSFRVWIRLMQLHTLSKTSRRDREDIIILKR